LFTGIVTAIGQITRMTQGEGHCVLEVAPSSGRVPLDQCQTGDSIAVAGVCLTMLEPGQAGFRADVSAETLASTNLGEKVKGALVNLELALKAGERFGGHFVSGHVDASTRLLSRHPDGNSERFEFELPVELAKYVSRKGSVCLDGVSLTVNAVLPDRFSTCIIPHTLTATTLGGLSQGARVNMEVDMIARYLESLAGEQLE
jgi:riboflavin synthase